jgi:hypothetical protein
VNTTVSVPKEREERGPSVQFYALAKDGDGALPLKSTTTQLMHLKVHY